MVAEVKNSPASAGDAGSTPGSGRSPGGGHGNPLQCSCLESPQGRVAESDTNEATWHKIDIEWENFLTVEVSVTQRFLSLRCQGVSWNEWI